MIPTITVKAHSNPGCPSASQGKDTKDRVFLLSVAEVQKYFASRSVMCEPTKYAIQNEGASYHTAYSSWMLRTMGTSPSNVSYVGGDGIIKSWGAVYSNTFAVRPAMWIDFSAIE